MSVDAHLLGPEKIVMDAVYRPESTPLIQAARARGTVVVPGSSWFVGQAALQFSLFTRLDVDVDLMRAEFDRALAADPS